MASKEISPALDLVLVIGQYEARWAHMSSELAFPSLLCFDVSTFRPVQEDPRVTSRARAQLL